MHADIIKLAFSQRRCCFFSMFVLYTILHRMSRAFLKFMQFIDISPAFWVIYYAVFTFLSHFMQLINLIITHTPNESFINFGKFDSRVSSTFPRSSSVEHEINFCRTWVPFESSESSISWPWIHWRRISLSFGMFTISIKDWRGWVPKLLMQISVNLDWID